MAQDLVVGGDTYTGVERVAATNTDGEVIVYPEGGDTASNAVQYVPQKLDEAEQTQARRNINAMGRDDIYFRYNAYEYKGDTEHITTVTINVKKVVDGKEVVETVEIGTTTLYEHAKLHGYEGEIVEFYDTLAQNMQTLKADGLELDPKENILYLTSGGKRIGLGVGMPEGGGGSSSTATMVVELSGGHSKGYNVIMDGESVAGSTLDQMAKNGTIVIGVATNDMSFWHTTDLVLYVPKGTIFRYDNAVVNRERNSAHSFEFYVQMDDNDFAVWYQDDGWVGKTKTEHITFHLSRDSKGDTLVRYNRENIEASDLGYFLFTNLYRSRPIFCYQENAIFRTEEGQELAPAWFTQFQFYSQADGRFACRCEQDGYEYTLRIDPSEGYVCTARKTTVYQTAESKADNLELDPTTFTLTLMSAGEPIGTPISLPSGGGSAYGVFIENGEDWFEKSVGYGVPCPIRFSWESVNNGTTTGNGTLTITVNGVAKETRKLAQGAHTVDVGEYLSVGNNAVVLTVRDRYGKTADLELTITAVRLGLTSSFDATVPYTGAITFPYTPTAATKKTMHFKVDGTEIGTAEVTVSGREQRFTIPAQSHGAHTVEVYYTTEEYGESPHLRYTFISYESGNTAPIIAVDFRQTTAEQYETVAIPYQVYDPQNLSAAIILSDGVTSTPLTVDRTPQTWSYRPKSMGALELSISCGLTVVLIKMTITESTVKVEAETSGLSLYLTADGRSNNEADPSVWGYGGISAALTGFNYKSDGWVLDENKNTVLRVSGDARVDIPVQIFAQDFRSTGKTIEIEFASRNVLDYDAVIATCWSGDRGLEITAQQAMMKSEQSAVNTRYKEDDHLRLSFVVEKRSGNRLIISYINGIISGMVQYPDDDDFSQAVPVNITLGSNDCTLDVYNIRIYDTDLSRFQMLDNWIADTQDPGEKRARYDRNNIFDDYGQIVPNTLKSDQRYMVLTCPVLPAFKGDKKTCSGYYVDPVHPERSFTFTDAQIDVQGTSSQYYYVKNFKIKFKNGFEVSGATVSKYAMNDNAVPTAEFTFKADVASSEGANNVVLAELYNDLCPVKTPAQIADPRVRQTIEGHPIVMFHDAGDGPYFLGKYNFNNDKGTAEVFGFTAGDESWEIKENGNAQVSFKTDNFTDWDVSFEARYPEDNTNISRFQQFVSWVASTDTTVAGLTETQKTARLEKFKNELADWADVDDAIFYYLFTLIFLCIDQREKNAFPTWNAAMGKWLWLFYDADSSLGTDNKGNLTFEYWMEDIDFTAAGDPVFNGQANVFWTNLRLCFADRIKTEYQRLRTEIRADGRPLLSYDVVDDLFSAHQSQWSEAIFNEDAWRKAVEPLESIKDAKYLPMQQGKKEQHFKAFMYNRFRYMDSKFETGTAMSDRIAARAHAQGNITLTSYINMYGQVYYNSQMDEHRMFREQPQEFVWKAQGAEDAVIGINNAAMISSLGDLSPLMLEYINISGATHLTHLKVGDSAAGYVNDNFTELTLGNNPLLRHLDVRNCVSLTQAVDASGCTNIEEVYFDGTSIVGLTLPNGGILKKLHLPATLTNLTIRNQPQLSEFVMPGYGNLNTIRLENVSSAVPVEDILVVLPDNSRVRIIGFEREFENAEEIFAFYDRLDKMRGLDEQGNNMNTAQMSGTIRVGSLTGQELFEMKGRYPSINIVADTVVYFSRIILDRTISGKYVNYRLTHLGQYAFCDCDSLEEVRFGSIAKCDYGVFSNCDALKKADFLSLSLVNSTMFNNCGALTALILRRTDQVTPLPYSGAISGTPIASGTGYVYVPRALLSDDDATKDYRRATNWSAVAAQFRVLEDWTVDGTVTGEMDWAKINAA